MKKSVDQSPHSLLHASNATLPSEEYLFQITDPFELEQLEKRLYKLSKLYINDAKIYDRIESLLGIARARHFTMHMKNKTRKPNKGVTNE